MMEIWNRNMGIEGLYIVFAFVSLFAIGVAFVVWLDDRHKKHRHPPTTPPVR